MKMSIHRNYYILIGVRYEYIEFNDKFKGVDYGVYCDSAFEGIEHYKGLCVLYDGMNGEYVMVGRVLYKTKNMEDIYGPVNISDRFNNVKYFDIHKDLVAFDRDIKHNDINMYLVGHYR